MFERLLIFLTLVFLTGGWFLNATQIAHADTNRLPEGWKEQHVDCVVKCLCPADSPMFGIELKAKRVICRVGPLSQCCQTNCSYELDPRGCSFYLTGICNLLD